MEGRSLTSNNREHIDIKFFSPLLRTITPSPLVHRINAARIPNVDTIFYLYAELWYGTYLLRQEEKEAQPLSTFICRNEAQKNTKREHMA